jgi:hypothetical protein
VGLMLKWRAVQIQAGGRIHAFDASVDKTKTLCRMSVPYEQRCSEIEFSRLEKRACPRCCLAVIHDTPSFAHFTAEGPVLRRVPEHHRSGRF